MKRKSSPCLVAIVGGSGAGKSWLAGKLQSALGRGATRISLDDFYLDRSHLPPAHRARINFDHPRAIDWPRVEAVLGACARRRPALMPQYDFATHSRCDATRWLQPSPVVLVEGLWLLRRPTLRSRFDLTIFIDCPTRTRRRRRLARDVRARGRTEESVRRQFRESVEPMHARYVAPQARWADVILGGRFGAPEVKRLVEQVREKMEAKG